MTATPISRLSRRGLLAAGGSFGALTALTACGGEDSGDGDTADQPGGGGWSFTDDRGETVELDAAPRILVAYVGSAAALVDYGIECTGVFGPTLLPGGEPDVQAVNLDVDALTVVGNAWGEFNIEEYARLEPDLLISNVHTVPDLWYVPEDSADEILALAPSVGILTLATPLRTAVERYAELAEALGADLSAPAVTEARSRFEAAAEALRQTARDNPGIKVLALSATADQVWFASPEQLPDLTYYQDLGVEFITPENPQDGVFEPVSWEDVDRYPADLILVDNRTANLQPDQLAESKPTWRALPAVEAGQVAAWTSEPAYSHARCAPLLEDLAEALRTATAVSGS
ncbi:ABC transporter substrate-binding protein [Streptomyces litchfieldiae]|uniref:ABC transporter substrate-binding protein n=1 Tax=Streptomyces litchfieldiae TaxID=3075543 RepID=A0ABU2MVX5_9ACTN|nr:ABC transporter substrate-binding protein [Streptomyces sp. DSM 44938]MDT0345552.1 ABC transporter substrate-binding protein [Streptomyces sp. DSM 44938]